MKALERCVSLSLPVFVVVCLFDSHISWAGFELRIFLLWLNFLPKFIVLGLQVVYLHTWPIFFLVVWVSVLVTSFRLRVLSFQPPKYLGFWTLITIPVFVFLFLLAWEMEA